MSIDRNMGFTEAVTMRIHEKLDNACSISTVTHITGKVDFVQFELALSWLFNRHPLLRATSVIEAGQYRFVLNAKFTDIPITFIAATDNATSHDIFSREAILPFSYDKYLWRAYLISTSETEHDVVIGCCHATSDALCLASLSGELLVCIEDIQAGKSCRYPDIALLDPLETLIPLPDLNLVPIENDTTDTDQWIFHGTSSVSKQQSLNLIRVLSPAQVEQVTKACRRHKTTVNAALNVACCLAIMQSRGLEKLSTRWYSAVNFRTLTLGKARPEHFSCLADQVELTMSVDHNSHFWALTAEFNQQISHAIKRTNIPQKVDMAFLDSVISECQSAFKQRMPLFKYIVSNIGKIDNLFEDLILLKAESFRFTIQNVHAIYGAPLYVSTLNNSMQLVFCFTEPMIDRKFIGIFADLTIKNLLTACQFGQTPLTNNQTITPQSETEHFLCELWQQLLNLDSVGTLDNFFELGGDSLLACKLSKAINKKFTKHNFHPYYLIENPTIKKLSKMLHDEI